MAASQQSLYYASGGSRRSGGRPAAAVKQLLSRLRSTWRRSPRRAAVSFGYDLHNYSQNFDDSLAFSDHRRL